LPPGPSLIAGIQMSVRASFGAGISVFIAQLLELPHPLYALISAVIVTDLSASKTRKLGKPRLAGTVVGAGIGVIFSLLWPPTVWSIGIGILAAMILTYLLRLDSAAKVSGYVCGIIVINYGDDPLSYALYRLVETSLGISVAVLVSLVPKLLKNGRNGEGGDN
jgi:uncharacterized membrane protein YgaE (UPF0421/DUF939 family)